MACNSLRIDAGDGSPVMEYRIENGHVENRILFSPEETTQSDWQSVSPEELSEHVMSGTILSLWLRRRMGIFPLVRACHSDASSSDYADAPTLLMEADGNSLLSENR
ncbi:MAG TPA: hypothetical protein VFO46_05850 [Candidatus Sulfotelmatobacter sp.]|nr:hypothetical protein [Candidatus Sulfotelmatobacter sp.]